MKVYQDNKESVNENIEIINSTALHEKARCGLMELSMSLGLDVMRMMLEEDVTQYAGPKGKHNMKGRTGYRHGTDKTTVVMGGRKVRADRPRVRAIDGSGELPLETLSVFQSEDPLNKAILAKLLSGVSTRKYARAVEGDTTDAVCNKQERGQPAVHRGHGQPDAGVLHKDSGSGLSGYDDRWSGTREADHTGRHGDRQ